MKQKELLLPAGNIEKMKTAIRFGANAVYLAGKRFGMRAAADNFTDEELFLAVEYCHARNVRLYVTVNVMPRTEEYPDLRAYILYLSEIGVDAVIVSDLGVLSLVKEVAPAMEIHVSTQASAVSAATCMAYYRLGAKRVVLARELSLNEIRAICEATPEDLEIEAFIHGSMCISYSGRCLLSQHFTRRDANRGMCTQPCRWNYTIVEETRPDMPLPIVEENGESFIMSSKDMCMIEHIPALMESGIDSFKIEGRMKSRYYVAVTANSYRMAIDSYTASPETYTFDAQLLSELESVSHREYDTGYYFSSAATDAKTASITGYLKEKAFLATVTSYDPEKKQALCSQVNKMECGQEVELLTPGKVGQSFKVTALTDTEGREIPSTPHPGMSFYVHIPFPVEEGDIIRGK